MARQFSRAPYLVSYFLVFLLVLGLTAYFHFVDRADALSMLHEDGRVEILSATGWFVCLAVMAAMGGANYLRQHYPLPLLVLVFGLRELDFDKRFTETGLLQSRILTSPDVQLWDRIAGVIVMAVLLGLAIVVIRRYLPVLVRRILQLDVVALGVVTALFFMVLSKTLDGIGRKLAPLGVSVSDQAIFSATAVEESFELGIPIVLTIAAIGYLRHGKL